MFSETKNVTIWDKDFCYSMSGQEGLLSDDVKLSMIASYVRDIDNIALGLDKLIAQEPLFVDRTDIPNHIAERMRNRLICISELTRKALEDVFMAEERDIEDIDDIVGVTIPF